MRAKMVEIADQRLAHPLGPNFFDTLWPSRYTHSKCKAQRGRE
jgi:hypothetical protein